VPGSITSRPGARLFIDRSSVQGAIVWGSHAFFGMCGTSSAGAVVVTQASGEVLVGDPRAGCGGNTIGGAVVLRDNQRVHGGGNRVRGALVCLGNVLVTHAGQPNTVGGAKIGQCSDL